MKYSSVFILLMLTLSAFQCKREGPDCHYSIVINNQSGAEIIMAIPGEGSQGCRLDGIRLQDDESFEYPPFNFCIERSMSESETITIYVVDPSQFNEPNSFYSCDADSIAANNLVLARYELTLADLRDLDFTIDYP